MKSNILVLLIAAFIAIAFPSARAAEEPLVIKNEALEVKVDRGTGRYSLTALPSGKTFIKDGLLGVSIGNPAVKKMQHPLFGAGQGIMMGTPGNEQAIMVFPGLPFALAIRKLHNEGKEPLIINRHKALTAPLDLGQPLQHLSVLGTGGLGRINADEELKFDSGQPRKKASEPKKKTEAPKQTTPKPLETPKPTFKVPQTTPGDELGSYVWMAVADPASRAGVVAAWLTQERASGVIFPRLKDGVLTLEAQLHYGNLRILPGATANTEIFALGYFADARLGLEQWADLVARYNKIKLPAQPVGFCTWYMEKHRGASDEQHFAELAEYAAKHLGPFGFDFVQIDDGWQAGLKANGPKKNFNEIDPRGGYKSGMKATADKVKALGLAPGIWFMPFAGNHEDPFFADKQDLFVKRKDDGKPYDTSWGGTCLDMTNPRTREYLAQMVRRIAGDWGYTFFKMDGMWTGTGTPQIYVNNAYKEDGMGDAVFHDPALTNIEAYRAGIRAVREAAGPNVFLLGCCVPQNMRSFGPAFGLVDAFRIGPDTGSGHIGSPNASRQYFLNGRVWYNDPDCVSVRTQHPLGNARANASFTAISGTLYYNSDWIPDLPAERLEILKRTLRPHGLKGRPVDLFEQPVARMWLLADERTGTRRDVAALFNWDREQPATIEATLEHIGLDPQREYVGFDFWENKFLGTIKDKISMSIPSDSCAILALKPKADHPQLLSTSVHVTQGMVDVIEEKWDGTASTLSGKSKVVANDPYELRIALPEGWRAMDGPLVTAGSRTARLEVGPARTDPGLARIALTASESCEVTWSVRFAKE